MIDLVDTSTRDGNQSLWGATGLDRHDIVSIAPTMERIGYRVMDYATSTHMGISVRYHREDPWEQLRAVSQAMPSTLINFLTTGMRFISWEPADEEVMALVFRCVARNGVRRIQVADPMNDPQALEHVAKLAKREGIEEVVVGLTYSISIAHDDEHYGSRAEAMGRVAEVDRLYLKDPGGLVSVDRLRELTPQLRRFGDRPIELHSHQTIGLAAVTYMEAARLGYTALHTAVRPLANGTSQPSTESTISNLEAEGFEHRIDASALAEASAHFAEIARRKGLPVGVPQEYDASYYHHQVPGRRHDDDQAPARGDAPPGALRRGHRRDRPGARRLRLPDRRHALRPVPRHPVGDEPARGRPRRRALRRRSRQRRALLPRPLRQAARAGRPGRRRQDPVVQARRAPRQGRAAHAGGPARALRPGHLRGGAAAADDDAGRAGRRDRHARAAAAGDGEGPIARLLREVARRPNVSYLRVEKDGELVQWRR